MDNKIMYSIVEKLHENFSIPVSICDASGRVVVSTDSSQIGRMNLLAIEALNIRSKVTMSETGIGQKAGAAMPLHAQNSRIGAVVIEQPNASSSYMIEILSKTIELLYQDLLASRRAQNQTQERDQFLYEWLHLQHEYPEGFIKRGELLGIDIHDIQTVMLIERNPEEDLSVFPIVENLLGKQDIHFSLTYNQDLVILKKSADFERKYSRILAACSGFHTGVCSGEAHLHSAYQVALKSLKLGKILFPEDFIHDYEKMKLIIALAELELPGIEHTFDQLTARGKNAQLAETAIAYIQLNGDIQKICERLHIHRNSIPYRLRRIQEVCGKDLTNSHDLLYLYASFIKHVGKQVYFS